MGLEKVKDEILDKAKKDAEQIIRKAKEEEMLIIKEAEQKIKDMMEAAEQEISKLLETMKSKEMASIQLESKKMLLEAKKEAINQVFADVRKKFKALSNKKKEQYIKKLLDKAKTEINVKHIYCSKEDSKFVKDLLKSGVEVNEVAILGGIIVENEDKSMRVDYSYETLLNNVKEVYLQDIAKILF